MMLFLKLGTLPSRRSFSTQILLVLALAQLIFIFTYLSSAWLEVGKTLEFAESARWVGIQLQEDAQAEDKVQKELEGEPVTIETLQSKRVLETLENEEPEVAKSLKDMEAEGFPLVSKVMVVRGVFRLKQFKKLSHFRKSFELKCGQCII